jgi:hypothetical protein
MLPLFHQDLNMKILSQAYQGLSEGPALNVNIVAKGHAPSVRLSTATSSRRYTPCPAPRMADSLKETRSKIPVLPARVQVRRCPGSYTSGASKIAKVGSLRLRIKCTLYPETWMLHIRLRNNSPRSIRSRTNRRAILAVRFNLKVTLSFWFPAIRSRVWSRYGWSRSSAKFESRSAAGRPAGGAIPARLVPAEVRARSESVLQVAARRGSAAGAAGRAAPPLARESHRSPASLTSSDKLVAAADLADGGLQRARRAPGGAAAAAAPVRIRVTLGPCGAAAASEFESLRLAQSECPPSNGRPESRIHSRAESTCNSASEPGARTCGHGTTQ